MMPTTVMAWGAGEIAAALVRLPLTSLVLGVFLALIWEAFSVRRADARRTDRLVLSGSLRTRYRSTLVTVSAVAVAVPLLHLTEWMLDGYVLPHPSWLSWLPYALVLVVAALGLGVVLAQITLRGSTVPEVPVLTGSRRTWRSFSSPRDLVLGAVAAALLIGTVLAAGAASSPDGEGIWRLVWIPVPNVDGVEPLGMPFFGWAYGIPVLVAAVALLVVLFAVLHRNAARAYLRPDTVTVERDARELIARSAVQIAAGALLLALAPAWRLIASAGTVSGVEIMGINDGDPFEATWRYAELAAAAGWATSLAEVIAFALLLLVAIRAARGTGAAPASSRGLVLEAAR